MSSQVNLLFVFSKPRVSYEVLDLFDNQTVAEEICGGGVKDILRVKNHKSFVLQISDIAEKGWKKLDINIAEPKNEFEEVAVKEWHYADSGYYNYDESTYYKRADSPAPKFKLQGKSLDAYEEEILEILEEVYCIGEGNLWLNVKDLI